MEVPPPSKKQKPPKAGIMIGFSGHNFSEPEQLVNWNPPCRAGLYAITVPDQSIKPKPFRVVYFGESGNMSERGFSSHHKRSCWIKAAGRETNIYISTLLLPDATPFGRTNLEHTLVLKHKPVCNR